MGQAGRYFRAHRTAIILAMIQIPLTLYWLKLFLTSNRIECGTLTFGNLKRESLKSGDVWDSLQNVNKISTERPPDPILKKPMRNSYNNLTIVISEEDLALAERDNRDRISRLDNLCKKYHMGRYSRPGRPNDLNRVERFNPNYSWFFWNRARKLGFCPVYKAGYSSWRDNMMILAGFMETEVNYFTKTVEDWARKVYGIGFLTPHKISVDTYKKLLIVRHPFERLLSAYLDKLFTTSDPTSNNHYYYKKYGSSIVANFRQDASISQLKPTWEEFISYIITLNPNDFRAFDDHWLPIFLACDPCLVKWDFIGKTETYTRDQGYIIREMGLEHILKPKWANRTPEESSNVEDTKSKVGKYYAKLTKVQIKKLASLYSPDFLLFGYNPEDYYKYGRDE